MRTFEAKTFERACYGHRRRAISITIDRIAMLMQWPSLTILRSANLIQMIDWINPRNTRDRADCADEESESPAQSSSHRIGLSEQERC